MEAINFCDQINLIFDTFPPHRFPLSRSGWLRARSLGMSEGGGSFSSSSSSSSSRTSTLRSSGRRPGSSAGVRPSSSSLPREKSGSEEDDSTEAKRLHQLGVGAYLSDVTTLLLENRPEVGLAS